MFTDFDHLDINISSTVQLIKHTARCRQALRQIDLDD